MKIENEAQAVSIARRALITEGPSSVGRALAVWLLAEYEKRTRVAEPFHPRRHLIVICETYRDMTEWAGSFGVGSDRYRQLHAQTPGANPNKWRGLNEDALAFVALDERPWTASEQAVFGVYKALGSKTFTPSDRVLIRGWLGIRTPLHG